MTDKKEQPSRPEDLLAARQEMVQIFKRGAEFTEDLMKENERLRFRVADLESRVRLNPGPQGTGDDALVKQLVEKVRRLEDDRASMVQRFEEVEAENKDFASRYVRVETENSSLMAIYVASYQLHSTLDFQEVLQIITEIILNFVGAEVFSIALIDDEKGGERAGDKTGELVPLVCEGMPREALQNISIKEGIIGEVIARGEAYFVQSIENLKVAPASPAICIPLKIKERIIGTIMVYKFLPQKTQLAHVDHELFTLLAGHAATAIFSAKLYTDSRRKLNTIQGLIDLVTS